MLQLHPTIQYAPTTQPDLLALVFYITQRQPLVTHRFMGRVAHKLFLDMLNATADANPDLVELRTLAQLIHDGDHALPLTISPIFVLPNTDICWLRVTALTPFMAWVLQQVAQHLPTDAPFHQYQESARTKQWWYLHTHPSTPEWTGAATYTSLMQSYDLLRSTRFVLHFITPTAIHSKGLARVLPEPTLIYKSLYERLLKLHVSLTFCPLLAHLELFLEYCVVVAEYHELTYAPVELKTVLPAFTGQVVYQIRTDLSTLKNSVQTRLRRGDSGYQVAYEDIAANRHAYEQLLALLTEFAFYGGVGVKTAQGMGLVRSSIC